MRVALCLSGYFGTVSVGDYSTVYGGLDHLKDRIYSQCKNVDVFVHCWQPEHKKTVEDFYSPVSSIFEEQIDFEVVCKDNGIDQQYIDEGFPREKTMYKNAVASRILSFYYSRYKVLDLKREYEEENNFKYDWVVATRFDIGQRGGSEVNQIKFNPAYDKDALYTAHWNQMNVGYGDMWFYGSSDIMDLYSSIYNNALEDFKKTSDYEKCLTSGWFDSNAYNVFDHTDKAQFTNELEKPSSQRSTNLMKFPRWRTTDSHLHHKWFCKQTGLYEKTRWVL
jgi:hypothetical protein